jgi:hypothetical protein
VLFHWASRPALASATLNHEPLVLGRNVQLQSARGLRPSATEAWGATQRDTAGSPPRMGYLVRIGLTQEPEQSPLPAVGVPVPTGRSPPREGTVLLM